VNGRKGEEEETSREGGARGEQTPDRQVKGEGQAYIGLDGHGLGQGRQLDRAAGRAAGQLDPGGEPILQAETAIEEARGVEGVEPSEQTHGESADDADRGQRSEQERSRHGEKAARREEREAKEKASGESARGQPQPPEHPDAPASCSQPGPHYPELLSFVEPLRQA
jgi:hypothetical protein